VTVNRVPIVLCSIALCLGLLLLAGCANQLAPATADAVIERALEQRSATGMPTLTQGSIDLQVGDIHAASSADNCRSQPLELADLERYNAAQVIHLDRPEPCKWVVTLSAQALHDVTYDDTFRPPSLRDYNTVSIALSEWEGFEITGIQQSGMHAEVEAAFRYRYTDTMRQLARANIYPRLSVNCSYDNRDSVIECARQLPMTFGGKAWKLDFDVLR
jgi:hypothetical protein